MNLGGPQPIQYAYVSQQEYATYVNCLRDIKNVENCIKKLETEKTSLLFFKVKDKDDLQTEEDLRTIDGDNLPTIKYYYVQELKINYELFKRISYINKINIKLEQGDWDKRDLDDCAALAAKYYQTAYKTMETWNTVFNKSPIEIKFSRGKLEAKPIPRSNPQL